ncbi:MAG: nucleotidyltransferase family protein [Clostridia bacterium]|nr:nucleotidyltransferase family protein [Clostridia bacterium]
MKIGGIIAEYNPFHNGHAYQIEKTKELGEITHLVAVMSSDYVQRGETSLFSKWARAEAAVKSGVDLVIELPTLWSSSHAQRFAIGGVSLLDSLGCVDMLSFGSECGDIDELIACKDAIKSDEVEERLRENLDMGLSYATSRSEALRTVCGNRFFDILEGANNTLGIEYLNAMDTLGSKMIPMTIKRIGAAHDSLKRSENFAAASDIRGMILDNDRKWERYVPHTAAEVYKREMEKNYAPCPIGRLEFGLLCSMRQLTAEDIALSPDVSEGIEYRIHDAALKAGSVEELYQLAKTKRYSHARIRRIVLHAFLGITADDYRGEPPYIRVLAMNGRGKEIMKVMKEKASLPIVTKASDFDALDEYGKHVFSIEDMCTDVFSLASPAVLPCGREKTTGIFVTDDGAQSPGETETSESPAEVEPVEKKDEAVELSAE